MPAALPADSTARVFLDYTDGNYDHTIMMRLKLIDSSNAIVMGVMDDLLAALADQLYTLTIQGARYADSGSNVTLPLTWTGSSSYGSGTQAEINAPKELSFTGKSITGHRWHLSLFGLSTAIPDVWKYLPGDQVAFDDAWAILQGAFNSNKICAISGNKVILNADMPVSFNDHFIVQNRG